MQASFWCSNVAQRNRNAYTENLYTDSYEQNEQMLFLRKKKRRYNSAGDDEKNIKSPLCRF